MVAQQSQNQPPQGWENQINANNDDQEEEEKEEQDGDQDEDRIDHNNNSNDNNQQNMNALIGQMILFAYRSGNVDFGGALENFVAQRFGIQSRSELWTTLAMQAPDIPSRYQTMTPFLPYQI